MSDNTHERHLLPAVRLPQWRIVVGAIFLLGVLIGGTVWVYKAVQGMTASWEATAPDFEAVEVEAGETAPAGNGAPIVSSEGPDAPAGEEPSGSLSGLQPWPGRERVSVLLLGIDLRCDEEGPTHTDSMMVVTVNPVGKTAAAVSLPRDLWVEIPGFGVDRVNQAYFKGEAFDYPGGGATLARQTVEAALGVPIDYTAAVNFQAFIDFVNQIGGIDVLVPEDIDDPDYPDNCYGYDPFQISSGEQHLDGERALKYARTRATFGGDVDRAQRQQQVVMAVRDKILRVDMIPRLVVQAPQLWQSFQDNVRTNLSLEEALQLGLLVQEIPRENIELAVINYDYVYTENTPDGQQVLVPRRERIRELRDNLFAPPLAPTPVVENLPQRMRAEDARIAIHNGTPTFGLAADTRDYLRQFNFNVTDLGNADSATIPNTTIIDYGSHPDTTLYLTRLMDIPPLNVSSGTRPAGDYDVLIILGNDWQVPASTPTPTPS